MYNDIEGEDGGYMNTVTATPYGLGKKEYCVGFMYSTYQNSVVLTRKAKEDWQRGLLNGLGGKLEKDETPDVAMIREWNEEITPESIGLIENRLIKENWDYSPWSKLGVIEGQFSIVHVFKRHQKYLPGHLHLTKNIDKETIEMWDVNKLLAPDNGLVVSNLKWIIPMIFYDEFKEFHVMDNWEVN